MTKWSATLGSFDLAVLFLCLAALFDGLDGHVARLLNGMARCKGLSLFLMLLLWSSQP